MYCYKCGMKLLDDSKFCHNCGAKVAAPEQDGPEEAEKAAAPETKKKTTRKNSRPLDLSTDWRSDETPEPMPEPEEEIKPVRRRARAAKATVPTEEEPTKLYTRSREEVPEPVKTQPRRSTREETLEPVKTEPKRYARTEQPAPEPAEPPRYSRLAEAEKTAADEKPYRSHIAADPSLPRVSGKTDAWKPRRGYAAAPVPEEEEEDEYDRFQREESTSYTSDYEDDDFDDDDDEGGFLMRHAKGIIIGLLFIALLLVGAIWLFSSAGQVMLAKYDLAWSVTAYQEAAEDAYSGGEYLSAGSFYEKAFNKDSSNYEYAYNAAASYSMGGDTEKAAQYAKAAISLRPDSADGYILLQKLYPDADSRPQEITQLLTDGYSRTGDAAILGR